MASTLRKNLITCEDFIKRLVSLCVGSGLCGLPRRPRDRHILLKSIVLGLDAATDYTEKQINDRLKLWLNTVGQSMDIDHVTLRRQLIELGYLERNNDGSNYRLCVSGVVHNMFEPAIEEIDVYKVISTNKDLVQKKKRDYLRQKKE